MPLEALQRAFMEALTRGPDQVRDEDFAGGRAAALRGLKVHANTISHARLVALEETFPRTRAMLGEARFNELSREFVVTREATGAAHARIGRLFPAALEAAGEDRETVGVSRFEWLWLEAYHAAEAEPLLLADLAYLSEDALLALRVARHPAARIAAGDATRHLCAEAGMEALGGATAILITRPEAEVLLNAADRAMVAIFDGLAEKVQTVGNLFELPGEPEAEAGLKAVLALLNAGALVRAGRESGDGGSL